MLSAPACAVLGPISNRIPEPKPEHLEILEDGYRDLTGVIHIHTIYSDGGGTVEDVARAANQLRLDYVVVTDHNTLKPLREGKQGWYGMTLVLIGSELSTRGGHYLALNIHEEIDRDRLATQEIIDEVNRQGGLGFIAHPYFQRRRWTDWTVHGFTGIEGYNTVHDALDDNKLRIALWSLAMPADTVFLSLLDRPYDPLAKWDQMIARHGRVVGIGSADAHEVRALGLRIAPYELMFKLIRTHVLLPKDTPLSAQSFYPALQAGHAYFSVDLLADAKGFVFMADDGRSVQGILGDAVALIPDLRITAILPAPAQLELFKDGRPVAKTVGRLWHIPITQPGAYRLEASRHNQPWIFSNPIYIRSPDSSKTLGPEP
ncbi:MAG: CehA/McbA family metallohydrolase [Candidatus Omnitrophica bacterium]|nr:CehA/McbA family metallohydrolase [Candidatus Omnitrophota bacterium]